MKIIAVCLFLMIFAVTGIANAALPSIINRVPTTEKIIALTIEDITTRAELEEVLKICEVEGIKATLFISGSLISGLPVKKAVSSGHELGNYGMSRAAWGESSSELIAKELDDAAQIILSVAGVSPKSFRPSNNFYGENVLAAVPLTKSRPTVVRGTDTGGWLLDSPETVIDFVRRTTSPGDIINVNMKTKQCAAALPGIIRVLKQQGFEFITVSVLKDKAIAVPKSSPEFTVFSHGSVERRVVALTFDDGGPGWRVVDILDILRANGIKSTFFLLGNWAQVNPELVQRMVTDGHELANHSYSHPRFNWLGNEEMRNEIVKTQGVFEQIAGVRPRFFRPPYGDYNSSLTSVLRELGYRGLVNWNVDTRDWSGISAASIAYRVDGGVSPGAIILFHLHGTHTAEALRLIIPRLREQGYQFATVGEILGE